MMIVNVFFNSWMRSSIFCVAMGSRAEAGSVHEQDFGFHGQGARNAQSLLLASGKTQRGGMQAVFDFVPQSRSEETLFDFLLQKLLVLYSVDAQAVGHVLKDGTWGRDSVFGRPCRCVGGSETTSMPEA